MDALYDDLGRMFDWIAFSSGKGCRADDISMANLRTHAQKSSPPLIAAFFHHYAMVHPELIEECASYSEQLPPDFILYRLKSYAAYPNREKLAALIAAIRAKNA